MESRGSATLRGTIAWTIAALASFQTALVVATFAAYGLSVGPLVWALPGLLAFHILLLVVLFALQGLFVLDADGAPLHRINLSNVLSLVRLSATPTFVYLIMASRSARLLPVLLPYAVVVFLTDLVDGRVARSRGEITRVGRYLDAFSDYALLSVTLFAFLRFRLVPPWFFWLVIARLGIVALGNTVIHSLQGFVEPKTSFLGKASIFAIMTLFASKILELFSVGDALQWFWLADAIHLLTYLVAAIVVFAAVHKLLWIINDIRAAIRSIR